jgi:predicted dehydrogenase
MDINYGLAGLGVIAKNHLSGIRNISLFNLPIDFKINLKGVFTTHPEENFENAKMIGFESIIDSMEKLVQIPDLNVVDICTPNFLHKEQVMLSVKYNKHIYCEKPLGMNSIETGEMLESVKKNNIINQAAFVMRFLPVIAYTRAVLSNNLLGRIYAFRGGFFHSSYLNPDKKMSWRLDKKKSGGGALVDLGIHLIDLVRFLIGEIESVSAFFDTIVRSRRNADDEFEKVDVDDWASLSLKLKSGAQGTIEASRVAVGNEGTKLTIYGDKGSLSIDFNDPYLPSLFDVNSRRVYYENNFFKNDDFYSKILRLYPNPKLSQGFMVDVHFTSLLWFMKSVVTGNIEVGTPTFEDAHRAQAVADAAYKSAIKESEFVNIKY